MLASLAISACSTTPKVAATEAPSQAATASSQQVSTATETKTDVNAGNLAVALQEMQKRGVYFDFNQSVVKPEYREGIQQRAEFLKAHGNIVVTQEGNTDERGSSEYNLSLAEKRANAVRKSLEAMGAPPGQVIAVSLGEAHPRLTCHKEKCWKENRRVDFIGKQIP